MKYTYWVRWFEPNAIPQEDMVEKWPEGMKGWTSGSTEDTVIKCARVDASSPTEAEKIVRGCYGRSASAITIDFVNEKELGWRPGTRFEE